MSARLRLGLLAAVIAAGAWFWWTRPSPAEREVRGLFDALAAEFNSSTTDGLGTVARAARIGRYFSDDIVVELGEGSPPIQGRETLMGMAARLQPRTAAFELQLEDVQVDLVDPGQAEVTLTAVIRRRSLASGEESLDAREFSARVVHAAGKWQINRVVAIDTLR